MTAVLRASVGETIEVVFRNTLPFPVNLRVNTGLVHQQPPGSNQVIVQNRTITYR